MGLSRFLPFVAVGLLSVWAVAGTHAQPSVTSQSEARPQPTARAARLTPAAARPLSVLFDAASGSRVEMDAVRDNRGDPWFARGGSAVWTRTTQGLALVALDGRMLERIPGATDIRESLDGSVRAHRVNDDWLVTTPRGTRRLLGPLSFPSLSPDGRYFAFELVGGRFREIHALELRSGEEIEVAHALGRCHCSASEAYGFPEWTSAAVLTFRDAGDFLAPPEEGEQGARFEFDLGSRSLARIPDDAPAAAHTSASCTGSATLKSANASVMLEYQPQCALPSP